MIFILARFIRRLKMKRFISALLICIFLFVGCASTEEMLESAIEITDAESFCVNAVDTIGGRSYGHTRYVTNDYVIYSLWRWDGFTKYYIDETGSGISEDEITLKVKYSGSRWIDYTFGFGEYSEGNNTTYVYDNENYYLDDDEYYDNCIYDNRFYSYSYDYGLNNNYSYNYEYDDYDDYYDYYDYYDDYDDYYDYDDYDYYDYDYDYYDYDYYY